MYFGAKTNWRKNCEKSWKCWCNGKFYRIMLLHQGNDLLVAAITHLSEYFSPWWKHWSVNFWTRSISTEQLWECVANSHCLLPTPPTLATISFTLAALTVAVLNIKYQISNTKISNALAGSLSPYSNKVFNHYWDQIVDLCDPRHDILSLVLSWWSLGVLSTFSI